MVKVTFCWGDWANPGGLEPTPSWSLEAGGLVTKNTDYPLKELDRALYTVEQFFLESERRRCLPKDDPTVMRVTAEAGQGGKEARRTVLGVEPGPEGEAHPAV